MLERAEWRIEEVRRGGRVVYNVRNAKRRDDGTCEFRAEMNVGANKDRRMAEIR